MFAASLDGSSPGIRGQHRSGWPILVVVATSYLFEPRQVDAVVTDSHDLRAALGDPSHEGEPSLGFPGARKSQRQLYRVLGNTHYERLASLLRSLDFCLGRGFEQPTVLRTRGRTSFGPALSELASAEHFLLRDFRVQGLDVGKASDPTPEFLASRGDLEVAVEVYHPFEWQGLSALVDELTDSLKNLDLPLDFGAEVRVSQAEHFDASGKILHVHPAVVARDLDAELRDAITAALVDVASERLAAGEEATVVQIEDPELNVVVSAHLVDVVRATSTLPSRSISIHHFPLTGYSPDVMFDGLVKRRVYRKAKRGQADIEGKLAILIIDMANSEMRSELSSPAYRAAFVASLQEAFGESIPGYDVIAFCEHAGWGKGMVAHFVQYESDVEESSLGAIFGDGFMRL
jgi:hypothetical protein